MYFPNVSPEMRERIEAAVKMTGLADDQDLRQAYLSGEYANADSLVDVDTRFRWDIFHRACSDHDPSLMEDLLDSGSDRVDIDVILKSQVSPLDGGDHLGECPVCGVDEKRHSQGAC